MWTIVPIKQKNKTHFYKFQDPIIAKAYYKNFCIDLLTGIKKPFSLGALKKILNTVDLLADADNPIVWHFFYEFGFSCVGKDDSIDKNDLLAIELEYTKVNQWDLLHSPVKYDFTNEALPKINRYQQEFKKIKEALFSGDIYQANLTKRFFLKHNIAKANEAESFCAHFWRNQKNIGAYAHASFIPYYNKLYFSNSPECLFQIHSFKNYFKLWTMPIKGTIPLYEEKNFKKAWRKLYNDEKNEAELIMICDLLWNDLNRIEKPEARVEKNKFPLIVNKILHQASLISVKLSHRVKLGQIMLSLFPGGSVTGAPKKKAIEILMSLEEKREFYCGSTFISYKKIKAASINIRSATFDMANKKAIYGAGGGITVHSDVHSEYEEMWLKFESFVGLN